MKKLLIMILIFTSSALIGCDTKGEPVEYASVCDIANDKKVIETSGYLGNKSGIFCSNIGGGRMECGLNLKNNLKDKNGFTVDIALDTGANSMDKPESGYQYENLKIRQNNGSQIDLSKRIKVTGTISVGESLSSNDGKVCFIKVTKIEQ